MRLYIPIERPRFGTAAYFLALLPFVVLAIHQWGFLPTMTDGDYAQYILHAKALVEGRGYTDTGYIFTPFTFLVGPPAQPPGLPLLLAPVVALFGTNLILLKSVVVLSAVAYSLIAANYFGRRESVWVGATVALVTSLALQTQNATISVIADLPFSAACWWLITVADRRGAWTGYRAAVVTLLGGVAVAFRIAGAAAGLAVLLFALLRPPAQRRAASLPLVLWFSGGVTAVMLFGHLIPFSKQLLQLPHANLAARALSFAREGKEAVLHSLLYPFGSDSANDVYHGIFLIPLLIGGVRFLVRYRRTFAWCFLLAYAFVLAVSPVQEARYIWPLYPILAYALVSGLITLIQAALRVTSRDDRAPVIAFILIAVLGISSTMYAFRQPPPPSFLEHPDVQSLFAWLREDNRRSPDRVVFVNPRVLTLSTDVPAMAPIYARSERVLSELESRRITAVIVGDLGLGEAPDRVMRDLIREMPARFESVYINPSFRVFRFLPTRGATLAPAARQ
ncbi:MAG: hypothetical protein U0132_18265 [Gemmatimonadaceae bacterium]